MTLRALQAGFHRHVTGDGGGDLLADDRGVVYREAYHARIHDALAEDFAGVREALGDDAFRGLVVAYLGACAPRHWSIARVGDRLADFLREGQVEVTPWIADLAALEWARADVFEDADGTAWTARALATVQPDEWADLRFAPLPAVRRVPVAWSVESTVIGPDAGELLVWRCGSGPEVSHRRLEPLERSLLDGMSAGERFAGLCERVPDSNADAVLARVLLRWTGEGWVGDATRA